MTKKNLEKKVSYICIWKFNSECENSGIRETVKRQLYDGKSCKCFAFYPTSGLEVDYNYGKTNNKKRNSKT